MRKIDPDTLEKIEALIEEQDIDLDPYALEKDFHVFEAIKAVSSLPDSTDFRLVFCGGTCLEKAHGLLGRMSEDVDFKVVPTEACQGLSKSALRKKLGNLAESVTERLSEAGFGKERIGRRSRDENRYSMFTIPYESGFDRPGAFRSELLVELNYTPLARPSAAMNIGILFDKLERGDYLDSISLPCVSLDEAYVEKLVSFPRRLAMDLSRNGGTLSDRWDDTLVRHLYDVFRIRAFRPEAVHDSAGLKEIFDRVIRKDADDFADQHPEFQEDFRDQIARAMETARTLPLIRN